jgi:hypothetical protein
MLPEGLAMRHIATLLVFAAELFAGQGALAAPYQPEVGKRHGDFTLPDIATGKPVSLSDFRGKKLLLIHFASW